ncbi:hypothetical protein GQR58_003572 [Nymphon striatum]|nr:hypothetical protein GQR58_003572 [Nymphon striatum]
MCQACVKRASEQRDFLPSYQRDGQGREEEDFGGERSGYRGGRRPRRFGGSGRLSGSGSVDVTEWVECVEGMCRLENVSPADIIGYVLEGNASRIYGRMMVGDASQWAVVKAALMGEYALPRALQRGNPALDFEGLAERMARAYRGHHSLAGRLPAIEGQGAASHGLP